MTDFDCTEYPLPEWAEKQSDGDYLEEGAALPTRDGRRVGNAFVNSVYDSDELGECAEVYTDAGSHLRLTQDELKELFWPPCYVHKIEDARRKFIRA